MQRTQLPARALDLAASYRGKRMLGMGLVLVLAAICVAALVFVLAEIPEIRRETRIWEHGVSAGPEASVTGHERSKFVFNEYKLEVSYPTPAGPQHGKLTFSTIFGGAEMNRSASVHYDRDHPDEFAVSWAVDASGPRWAYVGIISATMLVFTAIMLLGVRQIWRAGGVVRTAAREGDEVTVEITAVKPIVVKGKEQKNFVVVWRVDPDQRKPFTTVIDSRQGTVAWTSEPHRALALVTPDRSGGILLRSDLFPLALEPDERATVVACLEAGGGGRRRGPLVKYP